MRILLDECVPRRLRKSLLEHDVRTVPEIGWTSLRNGALLTAAQAQFQAFVTTDQRLPSQQNLSKFTIFVVVLVARRKKLEFLLPLIPELQKALSEPSPGEAHFVGQPQTPRAG
jgi:hypothetical protein